MRMLHCKPQSAIISYDIVKPAHTRMCKTPLQRLSCQHRQVIGLSAASLVFFGDSTLRISTSPADLSPLGMPLAGGLPAAVAAAGGAGAPAAYAPVPGRPGADSVQRLAPQHVG